MQAILGVFFHFLGGFASGSFYMPYKKVKGWNWETYWIIGGLFSWLIVPPLAAWLTIPNFSHIISQTGPSTIFYTYLFGLLWGIGGLTYGLGVRYLGVSLGSSIILGLCMIFGSLIPSIYYQYFPQQGKDTISIIAGNNWGLFVLGGLIVCVIGIIVCGKAGVMKEKQLKLFSGTINPEQNTSNVPQNKKSLVASSIAADNGYSTPIFEEIAITPEAPPVPIGNNAVEYKFGLGLTLAIVSGILSACFNFGLEAGKPMAMVANSIWKTSHAGEGEFLFRNNVVYVVVLWGGLTMNFIYCMYLNARNRSFSDYSNKKAPLSKNYLLSALAGTMWFLQFFFYGMGESKLGNGASSWILHMSFIILIANMWGLLSNEWKGVSKKAKSTLFIGVLIMIIAVLIVGYGNYLKP
jgi:L-rhamnose-H+ transport protein